MSQNSSPSNRNKIKLSHAFSVYFYNRVTYIGAAIALFILLVELFLFGMDFLTPGENAYLSIVTYVLLPPFLILGLILIPVGALRKRRRVARGLDDSKPKSFYVDPSIPTHRNAILVFVCGTTILILMTAIGSYQAFHYTESVHFCGITCHQVMKPEHTAYINSPHARVKCVDCHIGSGADWYVRSKLSGLRQVYRTILNQYPRPIPTPVHNLRPSTETCEQCHWPGKFYSSFEMKKTYFPSENKDDSNWQMRMLIHVGRNEKQDAGIHAHMYMDHEVYYVPDDEKRQQISWVKSVDPQGREVIFTTPDSPYKDQSPPPDKIRKMDCMDCHNRPTHHYDPPFELLNKALVNQKINPDIPMIKKKAMELLSGNYQTEDQAVQTIREQLDAYYQEKYPQFYQANRAEIEKAIAEVVSIFKGNFFPEMKARWDAYPDNIGHLVSPGCFRCHDGAHQSATGRVISRDCNVCHTIIEQGPAGQLEKSTDGLEFRHPFDEDESWKELNCFDCHTGN